MGSRFVAAGLGQDGWFLARIENGRACFGDHGTTRRFDSRKAAWQWVAMIKAEDLPCAGGGTPKEVRVGEEMPVWKPRARRG